MQTAKYEFKLSMGDMAFNHEFNFQWVAQKADTMQLVESLEHSLIEFFPCNGIVLVTG